VHSPTTQLTAAAVNLQIQVAMCVPDELGSLTYDAASDRLGVVWPSAGNATAASARKASLDKLVTASGGTAYPGTVGTTVFHALGGMPMGKACSMLGEVKGYEGLFVIDGSLIPGSTGCVNPSLTIAANAERIMDRIVSRLT
jgi:cholesterol oxidase